MTEAHIWMVLAAVLPLPVCVLAEWLLPKHGHDVVSRYPGALFTLLLPAALFLVAWPLSRLWQWIGVPPVISLAGLAPAVAVVVLIVLHDFLRYWEHRFEHRFWWPVHAVHHSIRDLHAANSYGHPLMALPEFLIVTIPLSFIDMGLADVPVVVATLLALQNMIIHSPLQVHFGPFRSLVVDSRYHRIHHSLEPRHFDRNFAFTFSLWDRLFGTAHFPAADEWPEVGVDGLHQPRSARQFIAAPLANMAALDRASDGSVAANPVRATAEI